MIGVRRREGTYVSGLLLILLVVIRHTVQWSPPQPNLGDIRFFLEPDIRPFYSVHALTPHTYLRGRWAQPGV